MALFNDAVEGFAHGGAEYLASKEAAILDGITYEDWVSHKRVWGLGVGGWCVYYSLPLGAPDGRMGPVHTCSLYNTI